MGFLEKVKNMFTEEIEEETPIKKEVMQVEIPAPTPKVEEVTKEVVGESEVLVKEEKPQAPVFFDDKDFANLERKEEKKPKKLEDKYKAKEEEKKVFRPTPIISPVYGVLDKNYRKDDITPKKSRPVVTEYEAANLTIDDVRKKAYGTLEDDLEAVIPGDDYEIKEESGIINDIEELEDDSLIDLDYEPRFAKKEDIVSTNNEDIDLFEEIEQPVTSEEDIFQDLQSEKSNEQDLTDSDLFNLIDSMYDKKDDE